MHLQHQRSAKLAMDAESEGQELRQCLQVKQGTHTDDVSSFPSRGDSALAARDPTIQWQSQVLQLEQLLAQQRENLKAGTA